MQPLMSNCPGKRIRKSNPDAKLKQNAVVIGLALRPFSGGVRLKLDTWSK
jgi:hypothetical protein